jgi:RNA polymerase-binding transcription factor DksA
MERLGVRHTGRFAMNDIRRRLDDELATAGSRLRLLGGVVAVTELPTGTGDHGAFADEVDAGQVSGSREIGFATRELLVERVKRLVAALDRLSTGEYGTCVECAKAISAARLRAAPEVPTCVRCQGKLERRGLPVYRFGRFHAAACLMAALVTGSLVLAGTAAAQTRPLTDAECQGLRRTLAGHAQLSDGVRRLLGPSSPVAGGPAPITGQTTGGQTTGQTTTNARADAIRARLGQIPGTRQQLQDQRVAAMTKFDMSRAMHVQVELENLDQEKTNLEKELAALPASAPASTPPVSASPAWPDGDRVHCQNLTATHERAIKIRQKELGAREGQAGAIPLLGLQGPGADQIARELGSQFAAWPMAASQVGLLDQDGDGRIDGVVDVPAEGIFRLYRSGADGTLTVQTFVSATPPQGYSETTRRLDEAVVRHTRQGIPDLLSRRPAGPVRIVGETAEFNQALSGYLAGNFAAASGRDSAARTREFHNLRGEPVRVMDVIAPTSGGLSVRQLVVLPKPNDQELWEETTTHLRTTPSGQTEVETTMSQETRTLGGAVVGTRSTAAPIRFRLDR